MSQQESLNETDQQQKYLGWHVVSILDLLGQQEALRSITALPNRNNQEELAEFKSKVEGFYKPFYAVRKFFTDSIQIFQTGKDISQLPPEQQDFLKAFRNSPIFLRHFSDSLIAHVPLNRDISKFPCRAIYGVLAATAQTMVSCLANKMALRGGIELGIAMNLDENEIYGPALARAHTLESKIAQYPRILIGDELVRYLHAVAEQEPGSSEARVNIGLAEKCKELVMVDDDGQMFLDYLGVHFRNLLQHLPISKEAVQMAYNFVIEQSIKHRENRNSKLGFRYTLLRNYFESRLAIWDISSAVE